jgi:hypothetical protein
MAGGRNLAQKYSKTIDERFSRESQAMLALNNDYSFTGVKTVNVYSIPVVPLTDYQRSGTSRYGTPDDLARSVQELTVKKDRDGNLTLTGTDIVPTAGDKSYPKKTITNFHGTLRGGTLTANFTMSEKKVTFTGKQKK